MDTVNKMGFSKSQQKAIMIGVYFFVTANVMYMITQNVRAYIGLAYPEVDPTLVTSLISLPNLFNIIMGIAIGPIAARINKIYLCVAARVCLVAFCLLMFANGVVHGPFWVYIFACILCGVNLGSFGPLVNAMVSEITDEQDRANRISLYNVLVNVGGVIILQASGIIGAGAEGAMWPYAFLLGLWVIPSTIIFLFMIKKSGYRDDKEARAERMARQAQTEMAEMQAGASTVFNTTGKAMTFIVLTSLLHATFYVGINAYYLTVSNYIITEHELGTSAQAGTANSIVRLALVIFQVTSVFWVKHLRDWILPVGYAVTAVGLLIGMNFTGSLAGIYICAFCAGASTALVHGSFYSKGLNYVPKRLTTVAAGLNWGIANGGAFVATYIYAAIEKNIGGGMNTWYISGIAIMVFVVIVSAIVYSFIFPEFKTRDKLANQQA